MRELLDNVSTTATRASSVEGSIFSEFHGSVTSEPVEPRFSFSEMEPLEEPGDINSPRDEAHFDFPKPQDSSQGSVLSMDTDEPFVVDKGVKFSLDLEEAIHERGGSSKDDMETDDMRDLLDEVS